ncbi:putative uncharacterized protein DDB_G0289263 [Ruditapes philippinarum]|uniref:putative uncharacterized protein DDB_G0289263 n=1 Tax=Ruditapes philippinarum TaxID=129788 RepID=UPI00295BFB3E|nr:putative uncharacterized protein DDB_G0289263 [Ruditapes philippinarum]
MLKDIPNIILLSGVFISVSVANVQLTTSSIVNGSTITICNSTVTYTCLIKSFTLMFFLIDDIRVATCAGLFCTQFQAMPSNADFIYNTTAGIFNLTFYDIKRKDTWNVIKCSNGTSTNDKEITQNIKDYTVSFKEVSGPTGYEIKIVTGCISNTTKLSFVWNMIPEKSSDVKVYTGKTKTMSLDTISCLHNPDCGSSESVKRGNILSITKTEGGSNYYIQSIVVFQEANISYSVKTNFQRMYVISDEEQTNSTTAIILIACGCTVGLIAVTVASIIHCRRRHGKNKRDPVENNSTIDIKEVKEEVNNEGISYAENDSNHQRNKKIPIKEGIDKQLVMNDVSLRTKQDTQGSPGNTNNNIGKESEGKNEEVPNILLRTTLKNEKEKVEEEGKDERITNEDTENNRQSNKENIITEGINKQLAMSDAPFGTKPDIQGSPDPAEKKTNNNIGNVEEGTSEGLPSAETDSTSQRNKKIPIKEGIDKQLVMNDVSLRTKQDTQGSPDFVKKNTNNNIGKESEGKNEEVPNADTDRPSQSNKENPIKKVNDKQPTMSAASLGIKPDTLDSPDLVENNSKNEKEKVEEEGKDERITNEDTENNRQSNKENIITEGINKQLAMSDAPFGTKPDIQGSPDPAEKKTNNNIGNVEEGTSEGLPSAETDSTSQSMLKRIVTLILKRYKK